MIKLPINYFRAGQEKALPQVTLRIAMSFVGVVLFSVGIGLNVKFNLDWPLITGALFMPIGAYLAFTTKNGCPWQTRLALAALVINVIGTVFVIWLLSTA